jgi:TonB family protein
VIATFQHRSRKIFKVAIALVIVCELVLYGAAQSALPDKIPPCAAMPDDPKNYPDNMVRPKYPKDALRAGASGKVELRAVVAPDGATKDLAILSGDAEFSQPALEAVRKWRFHPEIREGHPVETTFKIEVRFSFLLREANSDVELESPQIALPQAVVSTKTPRNLGPGVHSITEPGVTAPKPLYKPDPEFSEKGRREKMQGMVGIFLVVGPDGVPRDLKIGCSSVPEDNENALAAVRRWKFAAGTKDGTPVAVAIEVDVSFHIY